MRTILHNKHARWPNLIQMELWKFIFRHVVTKWNRTPRFNLYYRTPDKKFNSVDHQHDTKDQFKHDHLYGCPVYV